MHRTRVCTSVPPLFVILALLTRVASIEGNLKRHQRRRGQWIQSPAVTFSLWRRTGATRAAPSKARSSPALHSGHDFVGHGSRRLLQQNVTVHNALELEDAFERLQANSTVILESDQSIRLPHTLTVDRPGVTLSGNATLLCPRDSQTGALLIKCIFWKLEAGVD